VKMRKLDDPVEAFGEEHSEQVDTVTFATTGEPIRPGEFRDFGLSLAMPDAPGRKLTFKALQTYDNGEVVRWIGPPDSDEPAPQVELTATGGQAATAHGGRTAAAAGPGATDGDDGAETVAVIALVVGALGLAAGLAGLATGRRRRVAD